MKERKIIFRDFWWIFVSQLSGFDFDETRVTSCSAGEEREARSSINHRINRERLTKWIDKNVEWLMTNPLFAHYSPFLKQSNIQRHRVIYKPALHELTMANTLSLADRELPTLSGSFCKCLYLSVSNFPQRLSTNARTTNSSLSKVIFVQRYHNLE